MWLKVQLKSPIMSLCVLIPVFMIVWAFSQKSGLSFDGAYTAKVSIVLRSGRMMVKKSMSLQPKLFKFAILQPLFFLRKTIIPLFFDGWPCIEYLENKVRCLFFRVCSLDSQI